MHRGQEMLKNHFSEHEMPSFQSGLPLKQVFEKITLGHLKIESRRICQGLEMS
jgi:hypothetical protein